MSTESLPLYQELRRQIDELVSKLAELRALENEIIQKMFPADGCPEVFLQFDDRSQTVMWFDKSLKLGGKSYRFVKTLWQAPRRRKKMESLEQSVWKSRARQQERLAMIKTKKGIHKVRVASRFVSQNTLKLFLFRLQNRLRTSMFPYEIVPVRDKKNGEIVGYKLKCTKRYMKIIRKYPSEK
jgi:hypothetical protein